MRAKNSLTEINKNGISVSFDTKLTDKQANDVVTLLDKWSADQGEGTISTEPGKRSVQQANKV